MDSKWIENIKRDKKYLWKGYVRFWINWRTRWNMCLIRLNLCLCGGLSICCNCFFCFVWVCWLVEAPFWLFGCWLILLFCFSFISALFFNKRWLIVLCIWTISFFSAYLVLRWLFMVFSIFHFTLFKTKMKFVLTVIRLDMNGFLPDQSHLFVEWWSEDFKCHFILGIQVWSF